MAFKLKVPKKTFSEKEKDVMMLLSGEKVQPNVVQLLELPADLNTNLDVLVLPYYSGGDLHSWIKFHAKEIRTGMILRRITFELTGPCKS